MCHPDPVVRAMRRPGHSATTSTGTQRMHANHECKQQTRRSVGPRRPPARRHRRPRRGADMCPRARLFYSFRSDVWRKKGKFTGVRVQCMHGRMHVNIKMPACLPA